MTKGIPIVVSAASGTGKTSLCIQLLKTLSGVTRSVSFTTRRPRGEEQHRRDYFFVDDHEFDRMVASDEFLEWAQVFGHRYGTGLRATEEQLEAGLDVLLDIDVQGGMQIRKKLPDALLIFLLPPSMPELRRRLVNRATDSVDAIERRLGEARTEIEHCSEYDYLVVNDDFERAAAEIRAIITAARIKKASRDALIATLLAP